MKKTALILFLLLPTLVHSFGWKPDIGVTFKTSPLLSFSISGNLFTDFTTWGDYETYFPSVTLSLPTLKDRIHISWNSMYYWVADSNFATKHHMIRNDLHASVSFGSFAIGTLYRIELIWNAKGTDFDLRYRPAVKLSYAIKASEKITITPFIEYEGYITDVKYDGADFYVGPNFTLLDKYSFTVGYLAVFREPHKHVNDFIFTSFKYTFTFY